MQPNIRLVAFVFVCPVIFYSQYFSSYQYINTKQILTKSATCLGNLTLNHTEKCTGKINDCLVYCPYLVANCEFLSEMGQIFQLNDSTQHQAQPVAHRARLDPHTTVVQHFQSDHGYCCANIAVVNKSDCSFGSGDDDGICNVKLLKSMPLSVVNATTSTTKAKVDVPIMARNTIGVKTKNNHYLVYVVWLPTNCWKKQNQSEYSC